MANTTRRTAQAIHGTNPQFLIEKVIRSRIYDSIYWKEHCFALTAESLIDKAVELESIGGTFGPQKPSAFLCLVLKLLQLQPEKEILREYLEAKEFKYLRAVAAFYIRLTFRSVEVYELLEPMLSDYRKLRYRRMDGGYHLTYMDEFVDSLLTEERACDVILPRLTKREVLEETEGLEPRISPLEDALLEGESEDGSDEEGKERMSRWKEKTRRRKQLREAKAKAPTTTMDLDAGVRDLAEDYDSYVSQEDSDEEARGQRYISRSPSRSVSPDRQVRAASSDRYVSRSPSRSRSRSRSNSPADSEALGYQSRSPSVSPDRD